MKRVFLTGATGFVGSSVLRQLVAQGRSVAALLRPTSDLRRIAEFLPQITVIRGDLAEPESITDQAAAFAPECVLHLAWGGVQGADRNALIQMDNVDQALTLFRLSHAWGARTFLGLGSQAEYGPQSGIISENASTGPTTLYGVTKLATAQILEQAAAQNGMRFAWLRLFSSYGPDDNPAWLIPYMIECLLKGERPKLTRCEQIWDYIHVEDVARGVIAAMDSDARGIFNLGSGDGRALRQIVESIRDAIDPSLPLGFGEVPYRPDQVMHLEADITALSRATGWKPQIPLEQGLADTVAWHRSQR